MVAAARASGLRNIPDATASAGEPLVRPADGDIEQTTPNMSDGREADPRSVGATEPALAAAGGRDGQPPDRRRGRVPHGSDRGGPRGGGLGARRRGRRRQRHGLAQRRARPLGRLDRRPAISLHPGQRLLRPARRRDCRQGRRPARRMPSARGWRRRCPTVLQIAMSSDQIGVLAVGVPTFVTSRGARGRRHLRGVRSRRPGRPCWRRRTARAWVVPSCDSAMAADRLWKMLLDPRTFGTLK